MLITIIIEKEIVSDVNIVEKVAVQLVNMLAQRDHIKLKVIILEKDLYLKKGCQDYALENMSSSIS